MNKVPNTPETTGPEHQRFMNTARLLRLTCCLVGILAAAGCRDTESAQIATFENPQAMVTIGGCFDASNNLSFVDADFSECNATERAYAAIIADPTNKWIQVAALDSRSYRLMTGRLRGEDCLSREAIGAACVSRDSTGARLLDYDRAIPGNTGVSLPGRPIRLANSDVPGVVWALTEQPTALHAVDVINGTSTALTLNDSPLALPEGITDLKYSETLEGLVLSYPAGRALLRVNTELACDDDNTEVCDEEGECSDSRSLSCTLEATADSTPETVPLQGVPLYIDVDPMGDAYIALDSMPAVHRISLGAGECPIDEPCMIPLTWECNDGIDNDGDGRVDADDESCFDRYMSESSPETSIQCSNGIDDDADGLIDALDPDCFGPGDNDEASASNGAADNCNNGFDDDGDGVVDADDPQCAETGSEFPGGVLGETSFAPADLPRYEPSPVYPGPLALSERGDVLLLSEAGGNRENIDGATETVMACVNPSLAPEADIQTGETCTEPNTLFTRAVSNDATRTEFIGASVGGVVTSIVPFTRTEVLGFVTEEDDEVEPLVQETRFFWVTSGSGVVYSLVLDERWAWPEGEDTRSGYVGLARLEDRERSNSDVSSLAATPPETVPFTVDGDGNQVNAQLNEYPTLVAVNPEDLPSGQQEDGATLRDVEAPEPSAFIDIATEERFCLIGDGLETVGCLTRPPRDSGYEPYTFSKQLEEVNNGYLLAQDDWSIEYEGSLYIGRNGSTYDTQRTDGVVVDDSGWIRVLGDEPCEVRSGEELCDSRFGWNACQELEDLCLDGVDICSGRNELCSICPEACSTAIDFCAAAVLPGDIVVIPQQLNGEYCLFEEDDCGSTQIPEACLGDEETGEPSFFTTTSVTQRVTQGLEYRVVEVQEDRIRIEPLAFDWPLAGDTWLLPTRLPNPECFRRNFQFEVIAAESWLVGGKRVYQHDASYRADSQGVCQLRNDGMEHRARPQADTVWNDPSGLSFHIDSGTWLSACDEAADPAACRHQMRGMRFDFSSNDRFTSRTFSGVTSLAVASAYSANLNLVSPLVLFLDMGAGSLLLIENDDAPETDALY